MEKREKRLKFLNEMNYFIKNLKINQELLDKLIDHEYLKIYQKLLQVLKNEGQTNDFYALKKFILMELTEEKSTCAAIIEILQDCGQNEVAKKLEDYNTSSGPMKLSTDIEIKVAKGAPILDRSNTYTLHKYPRGRCVIINNVEEQQEPDVYDTEGNYLFTPKGLKRETLRFEHIFTQLCFKVETLPRLDSKQMKEQLTKISKDPTLAKDEAFVLILLSHGEDKKVLGYNACEAMRKRSFGELKSESSLREAEQEMERDVIKIKDIVDIFSEDNCPHLSAKPKVFQFICCMGKADQKPIASKDGSNIQEKVMGVEEFKERLQKDGKEAKNLDTFVSYSCAKGYEHYYNSLYGMSNFGLALTQSIAQYACDEPLSGIMNRTSQRLKDMYKDIQDEQTTNLGKLPKPESLLVVSPFNLLPLGNFDIEFNTYTMDRQLYFNPGFADRNNSKDIIY